MIASWSWGAHTAAQVSGSLARTTPEENAARNLAGMLSRFFASSECSKWPRNAKSLSVAPHDGDGGKDSDRSGGVGGAPPLRSSDWGHRTPLPPTSQHISPPGPSDAVKSSLCHPGLPRCRAKYGLSGAVGRPPGATGLSVQESALNAILLAAMGRERDLAGGSETAYPARAGVQQRGDQRRRHEQQHRGHQQERHHQLDLGTGPGGVLAHPPLEGNARVTGLAGERLTEGRAVAAGALGRPHERGHLGRGKSAGHGRERLGERYSERTLAGYGAALVGERAARALPHAA